MRSGYRRTTNAFVSGTAIGWAATVGLLAGSLFFRTQAASLALRSAPGHPMVKRTPAAAVAPAIVATGAPVVVPEVLAEDADYERLRDRKLLIPVEGYDQQMLRDSFQEARRGHMHETIDLLAPRGTAVRAADDGPVRRLANAALGGITAYQLDAAGQYGYYYAHLDRYAPFLHEGQVLRKGDVLGYVGSTGNAPPGSPHLHFSIVHIGDAARWWEGMPLNPYRVWAPVNHAAGGIRTAG